MLMIASRIDRAMPAALSAANEEPYSTTRARSRSYQTRWGMWCTSGCAPVAIEERQTGVSEGNVDTAREYVPCSARKESAGARPSPTAPSNIDGVSPSMTIAMSLVFRKRTEPGVAIGGTPSQPCCEGGHDRSLEEADARDPCERGQHERGQADEDRRAETGAAAPER